MSISQTNIPETNKAQTETAQPETAQLDAAHAGTKQTHTEPTVTEQTLRTHHDPQAASSLEHARLETRAGTLRVFNYYRVFLSFALLLIFLQPIGSPWVGEIMPELFLWSALGYIGFNVLVILCFVTLVAHRTLGRTPVAFTILAIDVVFLSVLIYTSGGVVSGMGNLLIFPVAFAGVLIVGQTSVVVAAISIILIFYGELHLMLAHGNADSDRIFSAGLLGIGLFVVNVLFQYLSRQLQKKESEVVTLEELNEVLLEAEAARGDAASANSRFEVLVRSAGEGVLGVALDGSITLANPKACELLETTHDVLIGRNVSFFSRITIDDDDSSDFISSDVLRRLQALARSPGSENRWMTASEEIFDVDFTCEATLDAAGEPEGGVIVFQDVSERKEVERKLNYMANYDSLTDLVNRTHFQTALEKAIARASRNSGNVAVLMLDVDHFKYINDRHGHDVGDKLLGQISKRLISCVRRGDTVARLGGDEFAILLLDFHSSDNLVVVARNLVDEINRPFQLDDITVNVSTSIGIGLHETSEMTPNELLKTADTAMYVAKGAGRNTYRFFRPEMQTRAEEKQRIHVALQQAIKHNEFHLVYQPIYSLNDMSLHHSEALIRWNPAEGNPIGPDVFIPLAEESGKINEIGDWVLRRAFQQLAEWHTHLGDCPRVAINVSTRQLTDRTFRESLETLLERAPFDGNVLELELTETGVMNHPETVMTELIKLHELGISVSIDDFGTGYSSLDYLRRLPLDQVKIDRCFIQGIGDSEHDEEIIRVIIAVAHTMGLKVIAEGIETRKQADFLQHCGCDMGQGYLFSRPVDPLGIIEVFHENAIRHPGDAPEPAAHDKGVVIN